MKRYLVTGGTGFIGRSLVRALVERGDFVRSFDDDSRGCTKRLADIADDVEFVLGDIRNPEAVSRALQGIDCCVHLAYINGTAAFYQKPEVILDVAVRGISNVIQGCLEQHVPDLCVASSSEVYQTPPYWPTDEKVSLSVPDPLNPRYSYGGGKIISELMTLNFGKKYFHRAMVFRPHNVYGPHMGHAHVIPQLIEKVDHARSRNPYGMLPVFIQGTGKETRAFIHIEDFTRGLVRLLDRGEHLNIYNIGNPEEVTTRKLTEIIGRSFDRDVQVIAGSKPVGETPRRCPDILKIRKLGFEPTIPLREGIRRVVDAYKLDLMTPQEVEV